MHKLPVASIWLPWQGPPSNGDELISLYGQGSFVSRKAMVKDEIVEKELPNAVQISVTCVEEREEVAPAGALFPLFFSPRPEFPVTLQLLDHLHLDQTLCLSTVSLITKTQTSKGNSAMRTRSQFKRTHATLTDTSPPPFFFFRPMVHKSGSSQSDHLYQGFTRSTSQYVGSRTTPLSRSKRWDGMSSLT